MHQIKINSKAFSVESFDLRCESVTYNIYIYIYIFVGIL